MFAFGVLRARNMSDKMLVESEINAASDDELETFAREYFKEDSKEMTENISNIQNWINTTPHIKNIRQDEQFLRMFLRG